MAEKNQGFVDRVGKALKLIFKGEPEKTTEYIPADVYSRMNQAFHRLYKVMKTDNTRKGKYKRYKYLDDNLAEAAAASNIYADNIVSGSIGGEENYKILIDEKMSETDKNDLEQIVRFNEKKSGVKDQIWEIARNAIDFGDEWNEKVIAENGNGGMFVHKLKRLSPETVYADVDERGVWKNPAKHYYQKTDDLGDKRIDFDNWRLIHFKMGSGIYGVDRSLFANAAQRIGRQLLWIDECLVVARMSRAWPRFIYFVDTSRMPPDAKWEYTRKFMDHVKRKEIIDRSTGRIEITDAPPMPDEDIGIPVDEDSPKQDVKFMMGDYNIGNIDDIKYLQNKFFMSVGIPKAYVALEEGTKSKATLSQIDVQFARQVRRKQATLVPGLRDFYKTVFILNKIDPDSFKWDVIFPEMATLDEVMKWEIMETKAKIAKIMAVDVNAVNSLWVLEFLLGMNQDQIDKYGFTPAGMAPGSYEQLPPETAFLVRKDPQVRQLLTDLKDIVRYKIWRQRKLEGMQEVKGAEREEELKNKWK